MCDWQIDKSWSSPPYALRGGGQGAPALQGALYSANVLAPAYNTFIASVAAEWTSREACKDHCQDNSFGAAWVATLASLPLGGNTQIGSRLVNQAMMRSSKTSVDTFTTLQAMFATLARARIYFYQLFGACRRRTPRARSNRRVASERSRRDASLGTFRSARVLGVRRRHAPRFQKKTRSAHKQNGYATLVELAYEDGKYIALEDCDTPGKGSIYCCSFAPTSGGDSYIVYMINSDSLGDADRHIFTFSPEMTSTAQVCGLAHRSSTFGGQHASLVWVRSRDDEQSRRSRPHRKAYWL